MAPISSSHDKAAPSKSAYPMNSLELEILKLKTQLLFRQAWLGQAVIVVNAGVLAFVVWPTTAMKIWWVVTCALVFGRMVMVRRFNAAGQDYDVVLWCRRFIVGATLSGVTWGMGYLLMGCDAPEAELFFGAMMMAGMVAGALAILASMPAAFRGYSIPVFLAVTGVAVFRAESRLEWALAFTSVVFLFAMLRAAAYLHETVHESILMSLKQRYLIEDLERTSKEAESAVRAKSQFLTNTSHEIRTPMNAVLGMAQLLGETKLDETQKRYLGILQDAGKSLLVILNDILDYSRIESGKLRMEKTLFRLDETLTESTSALVVEAAAKGLMLSIHIHPDTPLTVVGDPGRLRQVLINLVANAVKFTAAGSIRVEIAPLLVEADMVELKFTVADTGIGIPSEMCQIIFEAFTQVDQSTTRNYSGTGLGLSICSRLVEMMQGKIWVESKLGRGSRFYFTARFALPDYAPTPGSA